MRKSIAVGIDVGTYHIKVVITEPREDGGMPRVLGSGFAESKGLRHGYIIHQSDAIRSIRRAVRQAEKTAGVRVSKAFLSIGGIGLSSYTSTGGIMISRADNEVTDLDIQKALEESEAQIPQTYSVNRKTIHTIPVSYKIDGKPVLGRPVGMKGVKLEVKTLFVSCLEHHLSELIQAVEDSGIEIIDVMAAPISASLVTLTKAQKIAGCVLVNIGSETVSMVVYEDMVPISLEVFPIGSNDITNDIALGFKISLDQAEKIKQGRADTDEFPKKKIDEIVTARLSDIFELVDAHLKKLGRSGLLPAGIIITGGGSGITTIEDLAKATLKLPSSLSNIACNNTSGTCDVDQIKIKDATWAVAYGLCVFALHADSDDVLISSTGKKIVRDLKNKVVQWFKQFLP